MFTSLFVVFVLQNIHEPKFRKIKFSNNHFKDKILLCPDALSLMACSPLCWSYVRHKTDGPCMEAVGYQWIQECWQKEGEDGIDYRQFYEQIWMEWIGKYSSFLEEVSDKFLGEQ